MLYVHFETTFDVFISYDLISKSNFQYFLPFNSQLRTKFARMLLFAIQICHIIVFVEPSSSFDSSYLAIFKALKIIREKYLQKFLPKLLKNSPAGNLLGKEARLCSPRFLFFFEKIGRQTDDLFKYEIGFEDDIYNMLRSNFIITNNSGASLFSIPRNKRFLYVNTNKSLNSDPIVDSVDLLLKYIDNEDEELGSFQIKPYRGYGKPYMDDECTIGINDKTNSQRNFLSLIMEHVEEAIQYGFDDSVSKYRGKNHFVKPSVKVWYEIFKIMHKIIVENPENPSFDAKDADYKAYLDNFHKIIDIDEQFFADSTIHGYETALKHYTELLPRHFSKLFHDQKLGSSLEVYHRYARGPEAKRLEEKLKETCENIWMNGKQQCEIGSLRGNPCIMPKHTIDEHSSGVVYISTCNCGKSQGRREDPYSIKKANYSFYQLIAQSCPSCSKALAIEFPVFEPSINDFRAAEVVNKTMTSLMSTEYSNKTPLEDKTADHQHHLSASQKTQNSESELSLGSMLDEESGDKKEKTKKEVDEEDDESEDDMNELIVRVGDVDLDAKDKSLASTTEYLPNMIQITSPVGLLPQFASWSLVCIGPSSLYSHNSGLPENSQPGFLSSTNYLLPWDVKVRLEHSHSWAENYEKTRNRKKQKHLMNQGPAAQYFTLKIFVGFEYECPRGHRFMMSSNDTVLRGGGGIVRGCGSKVVFSDMPLYWNCPCRQSSIAQLTRVHIVTPKAPVNVIIDPKVKISNMIFTTGFSEGGAKLTQSAYWILRLPYIYQGENEPFLPPLEIPATTAALEYGCLMEGMFGVKENESRLDRLNVNE